MKKKTIPLNTNGTDSTSEWIIKRLLTYEDICNHLFTILQTTCVFIANDGTVHKSPISTFHDPFIYNRHVAPQREQLMKVLAINQLFNIAAYYNSPWKSIVRDTSANTIEYDKVTGEYYVDTHYRSNGMPVFLHKADAWDVIGNPNFKDILDTIYK